MSNVLESYTKGQFTAKIYQDDMAEDPRKMWGRSAEMLSAHRRYTIGDRDAEVEEMRDIADDENEICLPVYLYNHGGLTINTSGFSCPWDSGQVGIIHISREKAKEEGYKATEDKTFEQVVVQALRSEVEEYDMYLTGDVYGIVIEKEDDEHYDSCWGYYGWDYAKEEAQRQVESAYRSFIVGEMNDELKDIASGIVLEAAGNTDLFTHVVFEDAAQLVGNWEKLDYMIPVWYGDEDQHDNLIKHVQEKLQWLVAHDSNKIRGAIVIAQSLEDPVSIRDACLSDILFAADESLGGGLDVLSKAVSMWNELLKLAVEKIQSNYQMSLAEV